MVAPSSGSGNVKKAPPPKPAPAKPAASKPAAAPAKPASLKPSASPAKAAASKPIDRPEQKPLIYKPDLSKEISKTPGMTTNGQGKPAHSSSAENKMNDNKALPTKNTVPTIRKVSEPSPLDQYGRNQLILQNTVKPSGNASPAKKLNEVALKNMTLPGAGSVSNLEKLAPSPAPTNAPSASSNAVDVKKGQSKDQTKDKADETSEKPSSVNADFNETEVPSGGPSSAPSPAPAPAPGSNPANPSGTPRNNAGLAATGTVGQPAAGPPAPPSAAPAPAPAPAPSPEEVTRPADNGNAVKKPPVVVDLAPKSNNETSADKLEFKPLRADEKLTLTFSPDGKLKINDPLAARENARDLSGANGPTAKTLATAAATAKELQATRNGMDAVQKEAAGISRTMGEKVTGKQDEIRKLEAALDEEAKKGPITKERADYYRKELTRIRTDVSTILNPNTDSIGETANRQWDIQQRFAETQRDVLEESQRMLLRDQRSGNFKTFFGDYLKDGGQKLNDKGYYSFGNNDLFAPMDPFRGLSEKRNPFQQYSLKQIRDQVNPLAPFLPTDGRREADNWGLDRGRLRPELKVEGLLDGSAKFDFPGLKPRDEKTDRLRFGGESDNFGGFKLTPSENELDLIRIPSRADKPEVTVKLDDSLIMPARRNGRLETDFFSAGKVAQTLDIKQAYDAKLSPEERRALGYASDVLKQPVSIFNRQQLDKAVDAEKAFLRSKATSLENATNPMLDRLNGKIDLAQTQGLGAFNALEAFGGDASRFRDKGVGAYQEQMGLAQKDIEAAKTIETEFHSKETPHKVIPDEKVEGVRKQFQERVLAGDKATENPAFMTAYADQVRQAKALYGEKFVTDLQQIVAKGGGEKEIAALFKDKPNATGDILYATTLAGSMGKILDVDKARLNMVVGQSSQVVSQSEFKAERNRMILENPGDFMMRMSKDSTPISEVMGKVLKNIEDQGIMTKMGMGLAVMADWTIQNATDYVVPGIGLTNLIMRSQGHAPIQSALKFTTLQDLQKQVDTDLMPLSEKMHKQHSEVFDMGMLLKKGQIGGPGQITREEAERRVGAAWEEHIKLRKEASEKVQKYAEHAQYTLQNGKLAKDLFGAAATLALAIPTGGSSLLVLGGIGAAVKGGSTALDTATSAKGFDWKATALDTGIGFLEMAAGGGVGKIGAFTSNTILKTSGATLGRRGLAYVAEVGINAGGSAGVATFEPLIKSAAEGKPINPEELKQRALLGGLFGGGITAGLRAPVLVKGNPNLPPKVGVGDKPDGPPVGATVEIDPKTGLPVKKPDGQPQPVRPEEPVTPAGTNKDPVQPVEPVKSGKSSSTEPVHKPPTDAEPNVTANAKALQDKYKLPENPSVDDILAARIKANGTASDVALLDDMLTKQLNSSNVTMAELQSIRQRISPDLVKKVDDVIEAKVRQVATDPKTGATRIRGENELDNHGLSALAEKQLNNFSPREIDDLIGKLPAADQPLARKMLAEMTQYGNMEGLATFAKQIREQVKTNHVLFDPHSVSTTNVMKYIKGIDGEASPVFSKLDLTKTPPKNSSMILDDATLYRLETDTAFREYVTKHNIRLFTPSSGNQTINPLSQGRLTQPQFGKELEGLTAQVKKLQSQGMSEADAIKQVFQSQTKDRIAALGIDGKQLRFISNPGALDGSSEAIAGRLKAPEMSAKQIDDALANVPDHLKPYAREMLAQNMAVYSPRQLADLSKKVHANVQELAAKSGIAPENIYYVVPTDPAKGVKSFGMTTMMHLENNGIPQKQLVSYMYDPATKTSKLNLPPGVDPKNSMIVVVDDLGASGKSLVDLRVALANQFEGKTVISPLVATEKASQAFAELPSALSNTTHFLPASQVPSFRSTPFYQSLNDVQKAQFDALVKRYWGYSSDGLTSSGAGLNMAFPYMSPNNNNGLFAEKFAPYFTLYGKGAKESFNYDPK